MQQPMVTFSKPSYKPGERLQALLTLPADHRDVLAVLSTDHVIEARVVHVTGIYERRIRRAARRAARNLERIASARTRRHERRVERHHRAGAAFAQRFHCPEPGEVRTRAARRVSRSRYGCERQPRAHADQASLLSMQHCWRCCPTPRTSAKRFTGRRRDSIPKQAEICRTVC